MAADGSVSRPAVTLAADTRPDEDPTGTDELAPLPAEARAVVERGAAAWRPFLKHYTPFILSCIRRFAHDYDERMEIYVHVCRRLRQDDCRRLRLFRGRGRGRECKFSTWLAAVVFNLSREWIRTTRGRRRMFRAVRDMGRTDRLIFRYYFWERLSVREIASTLSSQEGSMISRSEVISRLACIERRLNNDHRWRLVAALLRSAPPISLDNPRPQVREQARLDPADRRLPHDDETSRRRVARVLSDLIDDLPDPERRALLLKFGRGLTARPIAKAMGIRNYKRVYEIQASALERLADGLKARGVELDDFTPLAGSLSVPEE